MNNRISHMARTLPAFTLPEMVVGMLLMAILFSFISMVYLIFSRQAGRLLDTNRYSNEYRATRHILRYDFEKAAGVYYNELGRNFILRVNAPSAKTDTIIYHFDGRGI